MLIQMITNRRELW